MTINSKQYNEGWDAFFEDDFPENPYTDPTASDEWFRGLYAAKQFCAGK